MLPAEPPSGGGVPLLGGSPAHGPLLCVLRPNSRREAERGPVSPPMNLDVFSESANTTATEPVEPVSTFKTGSLSVRKDMMARLPAMHIPDFKKNLREVEKPSFKVNELNLTSSNTSKLCLSESALRVLNTPNVRFKMQNTTFRSHSSILIPMNFSDTCLCKQFCRFFTGGWKLGLE